MVISFTIAYRSDENVEAMLRCFKYLWKAIQVRQSSFVVQSASRMRLVEVLVHSNVLFKPWKEAVDHVQAHLSVELQLAQENQDMRQPNPIVLAFESTEDGFGLLRSRVEQAFEGLDLVLVCTPRTNFGKNVILSNSPLSYGIVFD